MNRKALIWGFIFGSIASVFAIGLFKYLMLNESGWMALFIFPGGFLSGTFLYRCWQHAVHDIHRTVLVIGWVICYPFAIAIASIGGRSIPNGIGELLFFALAIVFGIWITDQIGKRTTPPQREE